MKLSNITKALLLGAVLSTSHVAYAEESISDKTERATEKTGNYLSDSAITAKVKSKLMAADDLKVSDVSVETTQGQVMLTGYVENNLSKKQIMSLVKQVKGVKSVKEDLAVKSD